MSKKPHIDPDTGTVYRPVSHTTVGDSLTEQHHAAACDVNNIMARYTKTGVLDHLRLYEGQYTDCPPGDYHEAMNRVTAVNSMFEELPSQMRSHFRNDPSVFLDFCQEHGPGAAGALEELAEEHRRLALGIPPDQATPPSAMDGGNEADSKTPGVDTAASGGETTPYS